MLEIFGKSVILWTLILNMNFMLEINEILDLFLNDIC